MILIVLHQLRATRLDVRRHDIADDSQAGCGRRHSLEELIRARKVADLVVLNHGDHAGILHLRQRAHVPRNQLALRHLANLGLGGWVEVVRDAIALLRQSLFRLRHVAVHVRGAWARGLAHKPSRRRLRPWRGLRRGCPSADAVAGGGAVPEGGWGGWGGPRGGVGRTFFM